MSWLAENPNLPTDFLAAARYRLQAVKLQEPLVQALLQRQDLQITCLTQPGGILLFQLPNAQFVYIPKNILRWKHYWQLRGHYDLVIQYCNHVR